MSDTETVPTEAEVAAARALINRANATQAAAHEDAARKRAEAQEAMIAPLRDPVGAKAFDQMLTQLSELLAGAPVGSPASSHLECAVLGMTNLRDLVALNPPPVA